MLEGWVFLTRHRWPLLYISWKHSLQSQSDSDVIHLFTSHRATQGVTATNLGWRSWFKSAVMLYVEVWSTTVRPSQVGRMSFERVVNLFWDCDPAKPTT